MEKISVIGIGRLGLCFCLTLENGGYQVIGCDIIQDYVNSINDKTFYSHEPGVNKLLRCSTNFMVTTDMHECVQSSDIVFVTVASFSESDGRYDVSQVDNVVEALIKLGQQENKKHLIICTNVNPGYSDSVYDKLSSLNWEVSFNPETIAQGTILKNQAEPDCVYIGSDSDQLAQQIKNVYENACTNSPSIHLMDRISAELTKVRYGFGWGGPCFPRDTRAYIRLSENNDIPFDMCEASININNKHLDFQVQHFLTTGQCEYVTDSVTYKKGTVMLEESQQLKFAICLAENGIKVTIQESEEVIRQLKNKYGGLFVYEQRNSNN